MEHRGFGYWLVDRPDTHGMQDFESYCLGPKKVLFFS